MGFGKVIQQFLLHEGPAAHARDLLLKAGLWQDDLHEEIWVFDQGMWRKDHSLWSEVQKANWEDVILKDSFKKTLMKDVYDFFVSEGVYKSLGIPWKVCLLFVASTALDNCFWIYISEA
jgi:transitional endoplasmic reticulum ATPase